jgi:hypothetical protein
MARPSYVSSGLPDFNYEYHTISFDTLDQTSANNFTVYFNTPLKQVVQARLLGLHVHTRGSVEHLYMRVRELESNFNDRLTKDPPGPTNVVTNPVQSRARGAFGSIISTNDSGSASDILITFRDNYDQITQFIHPIEHLDRLTVKLYNQNGALIPNPSGGIEVNHFIIKFVCRSPNLPGRQTLPWVQSKAGF